MPRKTDGIEFELNPVPQDGGAFLDAVLEEE